MSKKSFITLLLATVGGLLFAIGMCMCLIAEWNAFTPGVVMGACGAAVLLVMWVVRRVMEGKPAVQLNAKTVGVTAMGVAGALVLGMGMCMTMVWNLLIPGILVGIVGIVLLLCLIPVTVGLK